MPAQRVASMRGRRARRGYLEEPDLGRSSSDSHSDRRQPGTPSAPDSARGVAKEKKMTRRRRMKDGHLPSYTYQIAFEETVQSVGDLLGIAEEEKALAH